MKIAKDTNSSFSYTYFIMFISLIFIIRFMNIFLGINFIDESSYIAISYRFALGELPFTKELLPHQTSGLLLAPIFKLYLYFKGDNTGIVVFSRFLYFCCSLIFTIYIFKSIRKDLGKLFSWASCLFFISFVPFGIHALNYNSIVMFLYTFHILELYKYLKKNDTSVPSVINLAITNCISVFIYPTIIIPIILSLILFIYIHPNSLRFTLIYSLAIFGFALFIYLLFLNYDYSRLDNVVAYSKSLSGMNWGGGFSKFYEIFDFLYWVSLFPTSLLLLLLPKLYKNSDEFYEILYLVQISLITSGFIVFWNQYPGTIQVFIALITIISILIYYRELKFEIDILFVSFTFFIGGICTAWTSGNYSLNFIVGFSGVIIFYFYIIKRLEKEIINRLYLRKFFNLLICIFIFILFFKDLAFNYLGADIKKLTSLIKSGPYRGIFVDNESANFLHTITNDLNRLPSNISSIFFDHTFPAGHLLTKLPSASCTSWIIYNKPIWVLPKYQGNILLRTYREIYRDCILNSLRNPVAAVVIEQQDKINFKSDPVYELIDKYRVDDFIIRNNYYKIFILKSVDH